MNKILISTTEEIANKQITEVLGLVQGSTVRTRNVFSDIGAGIKSLFGGEIKAYVRALEEARAEALSRMQAEAEKLGADAVVGVRFSTASLMDGAAEILAYGTAVKLQ